MSHDNSDPDAAFQPPSLEELAALLPQFEMQAFLAQGGMGAVYLARQISLDRLVAIKVLPPAWGAEADYAQRFRTEARAMAKLQHNHIVGVFDFGITTAGHLYLVMEYVRGQTLHELIRYRKLQVAKVQGLALQLCDALAYAHEHGVLHRDIKPSNVLVSSSGEVKIADFGLARHTGAVVEEESLGTPDYAAPELFAEGALVDHRADIYALGIVFHEMLTGRAPQRPREPLAKDGTFDPGWEPLIAKATSDNPARRFRTVREVREAVANVKKRTANVGPSPSIQRPRVPVRFPTPAPEPSPFPWLAMLAVLVVVAVGGIWWWRNRAELHTPTSPSGYVNPSVVVSSPTTTATPSAAPSGTPAPVAVDSTSTTRTPFALAPMPPGHAFKLPEGHKDVINDVAVFPDQRLVASGSSDGTVVVWDLQTGTRVRTFGPVPGAVFRIAISPDGRHIAAGTGEYKAYVWSMDDPADAAPKELTTRARSVLQMIFSADGGSLILGMSDVSECLLIWAWQKDDFGVVPGMRSVPNGLDLLPGAGPGAFVVTGQRMEMPSQAAPAAKVGQPARATVSVAVPEMWVCDLARRSLVRQLVPPVPVYRIRITPDGRRAVASARGRIYYWDLDSGRTLAQSVPVPTIAGDLELLDGGRLVLLGGQDRRLHVIEAVSGRDVWTSDPADTNCTNAPDIISRRYVVSGGGKRFGSAGGPIQKDNDYALHVWVLPELATLKSDAPEKAANAQQMLTLETDDPELWALLGRLGTEWRETTTTARTTARKELDEKYLGALRRDLANTSPRERDMFLNEISRIANGGAGALDPTAPPNLVRLHEIYQQQVTLIPERVSAMRAELSAAHVAQLDALEKKRTDAADAVAATRVRLIKEALTALNGEMDRAKLLWHFQAKLGRSP